MSRILIIGATSYIAADVARIYASRGDDLYLLGRNPEKLESLVGELGDRVTGHESVDFNDCEANAGRVEKAIASLGGLDVAVIAHGLVGDQLLTEKDWSEAEHILRTNFLSAVSLLIPLANHFEQQRSGNLAVMSSVAGERGRPKNYTYGTAKGALNVYLQGIRTRLWNAGVKVHTLRLGPVDTPMAERPPKLLLVSSPDAAAAIVRGIDKGRGELYVPWFWRPIMQIVRVMPEPLFQKLPSLSGR